jgi:chromosome partitioning protein
LSVYDAPMHSTAATLRLAQAADLVLLPTGLARDDLEPTVLLVHELIKKNVSKRKIAFALRRTGDSLIEVLEAQRYIAEAGYRVLGGCVPEKVAYESRLRTRSCKRRTRTGQSRD